MSPLLNARWPQRVMAMPWTVILTIVAIGGFGLAVLYSAAGGSISPWAQNQGIRFVVLLAAMIAIAQIDVAVWMRWAYWIYGVVLVALIGVEAIGGIAGGSQRWLDLGIIRLQPSEFMKLAIILAVARFYHFLPGRFLRGWTALWPPLLLVGVPVLLVILQPDLGTALMILFGGASVMFLAGLPLRWFVGVGAAVAGALPVVYHLLHGYQKRRVEIFLDPESDPLGAGYHITQSKIAIGSGGFWGKGFLQGSQVHLDYLPERHTDFAFATLVEEWGFVGGTLLLLAFALVIAWGFKVALECRARFSRLVAMGLVMTLFFYVSVNAMMVMGLAPVVGIPMPLVSFGGSAMMTTLILMGILMGVARERRRDMIGGPSAF